VPDTLARARTDERMSGLGWKPVHIALQMSRGTGFSTAVKLID
jgi:hypothetical protein